MNNGVHVKRIIGRIGVCIVVCGCESHFASAFVCGNFYIMYICFSIQMNVIADTLMEILGERMRQSVTCYALEMRQKCVEVNGGIQFMKPVKNMNSISSLN